MEQLFTNRQLLFNIVMNTDISDLYLLYQTNHEIQNFLNEKYTLTKLSEKYNARYLDYEEGYYDFIDLVWDAFVEYIGFGTANLYLKEEIIRAVAVINNRYLNSGDKITNCDYTYDYEGEHKEWICKASAFLKAHGFNDMIQILLTKMAATHYLEERNEIYKNWLRLLKMKALSYLNDNTLLDRPFTTYTTGRLEDI